MSPVAESYEPLIEAVSRKIKPQGEDDWLFALYRFFLRADGDVSQAKADMLAFLQDGRLSARILSFARQCVEKERVGE